MFWERSDSALSDEQLRGLESFDFAYEEAFGSLRAFFGPQASIIPVGGGTFNRCLRVIRDPLGDIPAIFARFNIHPTPYTMGTYMEAWASDAARHRDFPTPKIIYIDTSDRTSRYPVQFVEAAPGESLRGQDVETTLKVLGQLGRELAKLHANPGQCGVFGRLGLGTLSEWDLFWTYNVGDHIEYCLENQLLVKEQTDEIEDRMSISLTLESPTLLHGDLSYDNVLVKDGNLSSVIDWEDAVLGDPIFELAGLATFHPESRHTSFIDSYYEGRERPDDFARRFWTYYLRIALAKAVHRHRFGYQTTVQPGYQDPNDRIAFALAKLKNL